MNARIRGRTIGRTTGQKNQHGRTLVKCITERTRNVLPTSHHDHPRASSSINDKYCVNVFTGRTASRELATHTRKDNGLFAKDTCKVSCKLCCLSLVLTAPGLSKKKDVSAGMSGCYQKCRIKYVKDVFCVN